MLEISFGEDYLNETFMLEMIFGEDYLHETFMLQMSFEEDYLNETFMPVITGQRSPGQVITWPGDHLAR